MPKKEHAEIVKEINKELRKLSEEVYDGKRIVVTGLQMDDPKLLDILEDNKLHIIRDYFIYKIDLDSQIILHMVMRLQF